MKPPFSADCMTLSEMLGGRLRLRIPGYQRPYAWTTQQAGQLLDDVLLALDEADTGDRQEAEGEVDGSSGDSDYFLGAVVLMETAPARTEAEPNSSRVTHEIVDGLQRLVTVTILLAVLRDIGEDDDPEGAALAGRCIIDAAAGGEPEETSPRIVLSGSAQDFLRAFVQQPRATSAMPDADDLPAPEARLLAVREHLMASLVGEPPERRRQLIDYLLSRCHCAVIAARTLDRAHHIFAVLNDRGLPLARGDILKAQILGAVSGERRSGLHTRWTDVEQRLGGSFEELFSHLRTIEGRSRARILDEIKSLVERSGDAEAFVEKTLFPYADILSAIQTAPSGRTTLPSDVWSRLRYLGWLGSHDWIPPLMLYWRRIDGSSDRLAPFVARLDRLAYGLRILGIGSDKRMTRYRSVLEAIRAGRLEAATNPLDLARDEQRLMAYNMRTLHSRSQLACKLVLLRLNDLLAGGPQDLDPSDFTVEHVLPQKPGRNSQWRQWFPSADERERCTQSIGNLILVSRTENEQARNLELGRKLEIYFANDARQPAITREIEGLAEWRPEDVKRREERLIALLNQHWQIGNSRAADATEPAAPPAAQPRTRSPQQAQSALPPVA